MVENYMAGMVERVLKTELTENPASYTDVCQCPSCIAHIKAIALNELPPFYVTTVAGEVYGEYRHKEQQNLSDVMVAVARGVEATRGLPCHLAAAGG